MSKKMILIFSHKLSDEQIADAKVNWPVDEFIYLPKEEQELWSNISPDLDSLDEFLKPIKKFLKESSQKDDVVLVQGDFGACYTLVNYAKELNLTPLYATTKRIVQEFVEDGKTIKKSIFEHRRFREYEN